MRIFHPDFHFPPGGVTSIKVFLQLHLSFFGGFVVVVFPFIFIFIFFVKCTGTASASLSLSVAQALAFPHYVPKELLPQTSNRKDIEHQEIKCEGISQVLRVVHGRV